MVIQIDKNVQLNRFIKRSLKHKYPFAEMELYDSFYVELDERGINVLRVLAWRFSKQTGWKFVTKRVDKGVRVWRVSSDE